MTRAGKEPSGCGSRGLRTRERALSGDGARSSAVLSCIAFDWYRQGRARKSCGARGPGGEFGRGPTLS